MISRLISYVGNNAWALEERTFRLWAEIFQTKLGGGDIGDIKLYDLKSPDEVEERVSASPEGVAVIPIYGTLLNRNAVFSSGRTYSSIAADIQAALDDDAVDQIVLDIDSPGGSVSGLYQLGEFIKEAKQIKPITAYSDGMVASAAYWIASAASQIVTSPTADIGSIGVLTTHIDRSAQNEKYGIKVTHIYSGKYKVMGNSDEPLSKEAKQYIQGILDKSYEVFLEEVAENKGISLEGYQDWAEGRIFSARDALDLGLVDSIGTMNSIFAALEPEDTKKKVAEVPSHKEGNKTYTDHKKEEPMPFDPKEFEGDAAFQSFVDGIKAEVRGEADAEVSSLKEKLASTQGVNKELEGRVSKLEAHLEKQEVLRKEAALKQQADAIFAEVLAETSVPENLHGKARMMLNHSEFAKEGSLDVEGWRQAVKTELADWEFGATSSVLGSASTVKGATGAKETNEDVYVSEANALMAFMNFGESTTQ